MRKRKKSCSAVAACRATLRRDIVSVTSTFHAGLNRSFPSLVFHPFTHGFVIFDGLAHSAQAGGPLCPCALGPPLRTFEAITARARNTCRTSPSPSPGEGVRKRPQQHGKGSSTRNESHGTDENPASGARAKLNRGHGGVTRPTPRVSRGLVVDC